MEIVIDIPNRYYEMLKDFNFEIIADRCKYKTIQVQVINAIKNGTPLPEHHGRLGDLDALEEYFKGVRKQLKTSDYKNGTEFFVRDEMLLNFQQFIHLCDTIIEGSDTE